MNWVLLTRWVHRPCYTSFCTPLSWTFVIDFLYTTQAHCVTNATDCPPANQIAEFFPHFNQCTSGAAYLPAWLSWINTPFSFVIDKNAYLVRNVLRCLERLGNVESWSTKLILDSLWWLCTWFLEGCAPTQTCWFQGSSFKGFSIVFPVFWLAKVESSQKSNRTWVFGHFSRYICSAVTETMWVTNYPTSFGPKKCSENQVRSCWDDSCSVEPTKT